MTMCIGCIITNKNKTNKIETEKIKIKGYERSFSYYIPKNNNNSLPVVIALHKSKSSGLKIRKLLKFRLDELAEKKVWKEHDKAEIRSYTVHGGGHTLPGSVHLPSLIFGKTSDDLIIVDEVINFFLNI